MVHDEREKKKHADSVDTTGMDQERMLLCVLHHPMDAPETYSTPCNVVKRVSI
jgi:hypothetical protein